MFDEDYTAGVLKGIPVFCINRVYTESPTSTFPVFLKSYIFRFDNNYGASVISCKDRSFTQGHQYELAVIKFDQPFAHQWYITCNTPITRDVLTGDARYIDSILIKIETLKD
jgi:hypothetical protein